MKISPSGDVDDQGVWSYAKAHDIRCCRCYDAGYSSIGCEPCTTVPLDPLNPAVGPVGRPEARVRDPYSAGRIEVKLGYENRRTHKATQGAKTRGNPSVSSCFGLRGHCIWTVCQLVLARSCMPARGPSRSSSQQPQFTDRVDVARIVVDVRALDGMGRAILDLTADDFAVKIHGKPVRVESATWVGAGAAARRRRSREVFRRKPAQGRLIVFLLPEGSRAAPHRRPDADAVQGEDVSRHARPRRPGRGRLVRFTL